MFTIKYIFICHNLKILLGICQCHNENLKTILGYLKSCSSVIHIELILWSCAMQTNITAVFMFTEGLHRRELVDIAVTNCPYIMSVKLAKRNVFLLLQFAKYIQMVIKFNVLVLPNEFYLKLICTSRTWMGIRVRNLSEFCNLWRMGNIIKFKVIHMK